MKRVLVCGSRTWTHAESVRAQLDTIREGFGDIVVVHGGANGADRLAGAWARDNAQPEWRFPAQWDRYGPAAGPKRNERMLSEALPFLVVAFACPSLAESKGTANMVDLARRAGVEVLLVEPNQ